MTKYIDAEKLKELIDEKWKELADKNVKVGGGKWDAEIYTYLSVLRIIESLQQELTSDTDALHTELINLLKKYRIGEETARTMADRIADIYGAQRYMDGLCDGLNKEDTKKEQSEIDLDKFTQKMNNWKSRYNYPDNISIKATMAFTARMFYMYPNIAKKWYDNLRKVTLD